MTEANKVSTHRLKDKINVVHPYNGLLFSLKREGNSDTSYNTEVAKLNEISQSQESVAAECVAAEARNRMVAASGRRKAKQS